MILIVCESIRTTKTVAQAMGANIETSEGIFASSQYTVAHIPARFIRQTPLSEMTEGEYPFIPEKFKMSVTMKELDRELKPLFREAEEVVFASDGGADAQARFFNICRHFRVGQPRSRMWLNRLCYGAIRGAFFHRESGRHLHRLAQTGLVSKGMNLLFTYNIDQAFLHIGLPACHLSRQEAIALEYIGDICTRYDYDSQSGYSVQVNVNNGVRYESQTVWEDEADADAVCATLPVGSIVPATMTVAETDGYNIRFHNLLTLQMDAFNNLGFLPGRTTQLAQALYEKGYISSPLTANSHLPEALHGHLQTVFAEMPGYKWGNNGATLDDHAIITLRAAEDDLTTKEYQLYRLIFNRMKAVVEQAPSRKFATIEFKVGEVTFSRRWEVTGEAYEVTETGSFQTELEIKDAGVYPCDAAPAPSCEVADILCNLTGRIEFVDDMMHTNVPFTKSINDYGIVISNLIGKKLISIELGNEIYLTPEGHDVYEELSGRGITESLLTWQFEANDLYEGDQTGNGVIAGFSGSLLQMVEIIDPETGI